MKKEVKAIWFLGIAFMLLGSFWTFEQIQDRKQIQPLEEFCQERGYVKFSEIQRWWNQEELLSIVCINNEGEYAFTESISVYNDAYNKPR